MQLPSITTLLLPIGIDPAGDVEELGEGLTGVSVGDRV